jgi:hypothetical protein
MRQGVLFYRSLTGAFDLRRMCDRAVSYGKLAYISVVALSLSACARMQVSDPNMFAIDPILGDGPEAGATANSSRALETEAERVARLEAQVAELSSDVAHLRRALDILDGQAKPAPVPLATSFVETIRPDPVSQLYALAPPSAQAGKSLFFEAELGAFRSKDAAEDCWRRLAGEASMADLNPRFTITGAETRLVVGPLLSEAAVNAIKIDASAVSGPCRGLAPLRAY